MINTFNGSVKSVTANVAKKVVTVSFSFPMTDETMPVADALGFLANKMPVTVVVTQSQMTLDVTHKLNDQEKES